MIAEKIELLGKGLYAGTDIPDVLTLKAIPTSSELDYVGAEDFESTMLDKILPQAVEEKINFHNLLEIDFYWVCRCLRFLNYGPYITAHAVYCTQGCGEVKGDVRVDMRSVACKELPEGFNNDIVIKKDEFLDFKGDVHLKLLTIQDRINAFQDSMFKTPSGATNREYARLCYSITAIGNEKKDVTPITAKLAIEKEFSPADFIILKEKMKELADYGLRAGGSTVCPRCGKLASFIALVDDRFLRPSLGDIQAGRNDRSAGAAKNSSGAKTATV